MTRKEAIAEGWVFFCLECNALYKKVPGRQHEDGHNSHMVASCRRCGCDLFARLDNNSKAGL
jgi:hypothetical protein